VPAHARSRQLPTTRRRAHGYAGAFSTLEHFMTTTRTWGLLAAALALSTGLASAQNYENTPSREQRMDEAMQNYRSAASKNPQPGPAARAEESMKRGAHRAGHAVQRGAHRTGDAIKHGAKKTGQAVGTGVEKAGDAVRRGGEALKEKSGG
jgi:hypothetical protein